MSSHRFWGKHSGSTNCIADDASYITAGSRRQVLDNIDEHEDGKYPGAMSPLGYGRMKKTECIEHYRIAVRLFARTAVRHDAHDVEQRIYGIPLTHQVLRRQ